MSKGTYACIKGVSFISYSVHAIVIGNVQGFGFRFSTQQLANKYHLSGWVKNVNDGNVEMHAEGEKNEIDAFLSEIKANPSPFSRVEKVIINNNEKLKGYTSFKIMY